MKIDISDFDTPHNVIAEIGTSHRGDISYAKELIDAAAKSSANIIKLQWVIASEIVSPHVGEIVLLNRKINIFNRFQAVEQDIDFYIQIKEYVEKKNLQFLCSVFGMKSLSMLLSLHPSYIKIASPEVNYIELLDTVNTWNKQHNTQVSVILSDGISSYMDIAHIISRYPKLPIIILRCVTQYPTPLHKYQLSRMLKYRSLFQCQIGLSDHTVHPFIMPVLASILGSSYTEKHFTLNKNDAGLDDSFALLPEEFKIMVDAINVARMQTSTLSCINIDTITNIVEQIITQYSPMGEELSHTSISATIQHIIEGKGYSPPCMPIYYSTRRSIFSSKSIRKGTILNTSNTIMLRSETNIQHGIPAEYCDIVHGYAIISDIDAYQPITWSELTCN